MSTSGIPEGLKIAIVELAIPQAHPWEPYPFPVLVSRWEKVRLVLYQLRWWLVKDFVKRRSFLDGRVFNSDEDFLELWTLLVQEYFKIFVNGIITDLTPAFVMLDKAIQEFTEIMAPLAENLFSELEMDNVDWEVQNKNGSNQEK